MLSTERIYLLPYYFQFLKFGPAGKGRISSALDMEGEWVHKGIVYETPEAEWIVLATRTATRGALISLFEHKGQKSAKVLRRVLLAVTVPDTLIEGAKKLGVSIYKFPADPTFTQVPCSLCGTRIAPIHYPWRCPSCPSEFGSDYRLVICHQCGIAFRTAPRVEREVFAAIDDSAVWNKTPLCPDCRKASLETPVLGFDGTLRNLILLGLLRGRLKLEKLPSLGVPLEYVNRIIRPAFMRMAALPMGSPAAATTEMPPLNEIIAPGSAPALLSLVEGEENEGSRVAISTKVDVALGFSEERGGVGNQLLEDEISALEQASRRGILRRPDEDAKTYLERMTALPPSHVKPTAYQSLDAMDADLVEACRKLTERDLMELMKAASDIASKIGSQLEASQSAGEDLLSYVARLKSIAPKD